MNISLQPLVLYFYGIFLISCGVVAVTFIGSKAKTALVSGGLSGCTTLLIAYLFTLEIKGIALAGILFSFVLFIVFSWRVTKTLFSIFDLIATNHLELKGKGIAFLIISFMAIVSFAVFVVQLLLFLL